jgi:hypothetical protein
MCDLFKMTNRSTTTVSHSAYLLMRQQVERAAVCRDSDW